MADVFNDVKGIISKYSSLRVEALTPETRLDEIGVESIDLIEIVFQIEEHFKIDVPYNSNTKSGLEFATVGQIAEGVRSILDKSKAS